MKKIRKILAIETSCDETAAAVIEIPDCQPAHPMCLPREASAKWGHPEPSLCHCEESATRQSLVFDSEFAQTREANVRPLILSSVVSSQIDLHAKTGGVVPEVASRAHLESIIPVIEQALKQGIKKSECKNPNKTSMTNVLNLKNSDLDICSSFAIPHSGLFQGIDAIAVTSGPGLIGALLVGFNTAKALAYALDIPLIPINHIEGHIYSALSGVSYEITNSDTKLRNYESKKLSSGVGSDSREVGFSEPNFPLLALTVSGGHTSLTLMKDHGVYETIGETVDDAAGEAFDKVAKMLDLGYPGGPVISKLAEQFRNRVKSRKPIKSKAKEKPSRPNGDPSGRVGLDSSGVGFSDKCPLDIQFPRPMLHSGDFNFSFSGLKTAVLHKVRELITDNREKPSREVGLDSSGVGFSLPDDLKAQLCCAFEDAVVDVLITKTRGASKKYDIDNIIVAGGVSANQHLRAEFNFRLSTFDFRLSFPPPEMTGDNAAMIGLAAAYHLICSPREASAKWGHPTRPLCHPELVSGSINSSWKTTTVDSNLRL